MHRRGDLRRVSAAVSCAMNATKENEKGKKKKKKDVNESTADSDVRVNTARDDARTRRKNAENERVEKEQVRSGNDRLRLIPNTETGIVSARAQFAFPTAILIEYILYA